MDADRGSNHMPFDNRPVNQLGATLSEVAGCEFRVANSAGKCQSRATTVLHRGATPSKARRFEKSLILKDFLAVPKRWRREGGIRTHCTARVVDNPLTSKAGMGGPHQFHTRNDISGTQRTRSISDENTTKSTKPAFILPIITVWLQVRVLPAQQ